LRDETIVKISAIVALTTICVVATMHGIDSVLLSAVSAIIGGIAGYEFKDFKNYLKKRGK
jgi:hypothetical protein